YRRCIGFRLFLDAIDRSGRFGWLRDRRSLRFAFPFFATNRRHGKWRDLRQLEGRRSLTRRLPRAMPPRPEGRRIRQPGIRIVGLTGLRPVRRAGRREHLGRHRIVVRGAPAANFDPHIVAAARGDDREMLLTIFWKWRQFVLNSPELLERGARLEGQHLLEDAGDGFEGERSRGELNLTGRRDNVRLFADVDDEGLAVETDDGLKQ